MLVAGTRQTTFDSHMTLTNNMLLRVMGDDGDTSSESLAGINGLTFRVY